MTRFDDDALRRLLQQSAPEATPDLDRMWKRVQARRRFSRRIRAATGIGLAAGIAAILAFPFAQGTRDAAVPAGVAAVDSVARELEDWIKPRFARLDPVVQSALIGDLAALDTAVGEMDDFKPRSRDQEESKASQRDQLVRRRAALLRRAAEQTGTEYP